MLWLSLLSTLITICNALPAQQQIPLLRHATDNRTVSIELFAELEELARIVDISYCVGLTGTGIAKPFKCISRCSEFPDFELVKTWNTGLLMSDSCGYIALSHLPSKPRIIVAFRGTYSIANTVVDLSTIPQEYIPYPGDPESDGSDQTHESSPPKCNNCTVHTGFYSSWRVAASAILPDLQAVIEAHPDYELTLVGHSLGGAVAALAGLDFVSRGWNPTVTTFGEPRLGNQALNHYLDQRFNLPIGIGALEKHPRYRRVTHVNDPVPLLPLKEWGYRMHAGEIYISKSALSPDVRDLQHCFGDEDRQCIAGQSSARYKLWQLFFSHRDYFWRLGLCVPGGDPWDWGRQPYDSFDI